MTSYERSVFLNCPFDDSFAPLFYAAVLTIAALGFTPRCARESEGESDPRIDRIAKGLRESKYSIHDLSRFQGEGPDNLSRFNMPLELGMAVSIRYQGRYQGNASGPPHNWVSLVPIGFVHQRFISDLAGFDPPTHDQTPISVIRAIAGWLSIQPDYSPPAPSAKAVLDAYPRLIELLEKAKIDALGYLSWPAIIENVERVISAMSEPN
jgi:hypothetical protein